MTDTVNRQEFTFQTEIRQLLQILSHSLYQNKEITIRELVSNASDSLNKMRYIQLTDEQFRDDAELEVVLEPNKDERILTIRDNGVGLTRDELVANLGTIAHSGSLEFLNKLTGDAKADLSLIGQFGVGFYSAFMLADRVEVLTRSYKEQSGWRWESDGTGSYSIEAAEELPRGAQIRLHLKEGLDEFLSPDRLRHIIRKYSTFVPHPIRLEGEQLNEQRPIWVEPRSQLTEEQYNNFYQFLTHRTDEKPLWHVHFSSDSPLQFHAILYCPETNLELMGFGVSEHGLHLCAKRILVQDDCRDLLPEYLRFLYGLVDSADLPLNVSRETLQDSTILRKIKKVLTKRVLDHLLKLAEEQRDDYLKFYRQFGPILRTGVGTDFENREKVAQLMRFRSSHAGGDDELTSLDEYLKRAHPEQKQIYYFGGPDAATIAKSPNLEIFRTKNLEVLYLTEPMDEMLLTNLHTYKDKQLISVDAADVEFPPVAGEADKADADKADADKPQDGDKAVPGGFDRVLELFRSALGDEVTEIRKSERLTDSPVCLVNPSGALSAQLQKVLQMSDREFKRSKRILEVNPTAPLIQRLSQLSTNADHESFIQECGRQLYANALLLEGVVPEPDEVVRRMQRFMDDLASTRSPAEK